MLDLNALPRKGRLSVADREAFAQPFAEARRQHPRSVLSIAVSNGAVCTPVLAANLHRSTTAHA